MTTLEQTRLAVIGLGYVGLPLAVEFAKKFPVTGFDIKEDRIRELLSGHDSTLEVEDRNLKSVLNPGTGNSAAPSGKSLHAAVPPAGEAYRKQGGEVFPEGNSPSPQSEKGPGDETETRYGRPPAGLHITSTLNDLVGCNVFIVTVPTPVDKNNRPDLTPLVKASETVGKVIRKGGVVIYESTVYPGCTEEDCLPVVERISGLKYNVDFFAGYSPERINPGDKVNTVLTIKKITSGSTPEIADFVDALYNTILLNGTHKAPSLKVAEAAKVIENSQRDINIAFMNELAKICSYFGIDTNDVLEAAGSKWNFLKFKPGLVGGHCIGIDPFYIAQKAEEAGYYPELILASRRMNDGMGKWIANRVVKLMISKDIAVKGAHVLVLGITFKENCPDIRNSKVIDLIHEFRDFGCKVDVFDPWADPQEVRHEYHLDLLKNDALLSGENPLYDAIVLAVAHNEFTTIDIRKLTAGRSVIYDIKGLLDRKLTDGRL